MKTDCFAYGHDCQVLTEKNCNGCAFYKTKKQFKQSFQATKDKLRERGMLQQYKDNYPVLADMCKKI